MSTVEIRLAGADVTDFVIFKDTQFTQQANGQPGTCFVRLRDLEHVLEPHAGNTLTVDVDGIRVWGGWALRATPGYFFAVDDTTDPQITERQWTLEGVDYNILFSKRFLINKSNPTQMLPFYPAGTPDDVVVLDVVSRFLELGGDGIDTSGVTHVGTPNPDSAGNVGNPGTSWGACMSLIARPTQAVFYIDPNKVLRYVDVETVTAPFGLSDTPNNTTTFGYREMDVTLDGTRLVNDMLVWGAAPHATPDITFKRVQDATSIADHGRWQAGEFTTALYTDQGVNQRARSFVYGSPQSKRGGKDNAIQVSCVTYKPGLVAGQIANFNSTVFGYSDALPVRRLGIRFATQKDVEFHAYLSYDIDAPWSDYEFWFPRINFNITPINVITIDPPPRFPPPTDCVCGITDDFDRPDVSGDLGTASCGVDWSISAGSWSIVSNEGQAAITTYAEADLPCPATSDVTVTMRMSSTGSNHFAFLGGSGLFFIEVDVYGNGFVEAFNDIDDQTTTISINTLQDFKVRYTLDGVQMLVWVWQASVAMPSTPTLTLSTNMASISGFVYIGGNVVTGLPFTATYNNLTAIGVDKCTTFMFDSLLDRFVSSGWGTSTTGVTWTQFGPGTADYSVDQTNGGKILQNDPGTVPNQRGNTYIYTDDQPDAWSGDFSFTAKFNATQFPDAAHTGTLAQWAVFLSEDDPITGSLDQAVFFSKRDNLHGGADTLSFLPGGGGTTTVVPKSWLVGASYWLRWTKTGTAHQIRVWADGAAEPTTWDIETTGAVIAPGAFGIFQQQPFTRLFLSDPDATLFMRWFNLNFDFTGKDCFDGVPPTPTQTPSGVRCETLPGGGTTVFAVSQAYVPNSTKVYLNGLLQRNGLDYTESSPSTGQVTFGQPTPVGAVTICYNASL